MKPLFGAINAKIGKTIAENLPAASRYCEPFGDGGAFALYLQKRPAREHIVNILDEDLLFGLRFVQDASGATTRQLKGFDWVGSQEAFDRAMGTSAQDGPERFWRFLYVKKFGMSMSPGAPPTFDVLSTGKDLSQSLSAIPMMRAGLRRATLLSEEPLGLLGRLDGPGTLHILLPPPDQAEAVRGRLDGLRGPAFCAIAVQDPMEIFDAARAAAGSRRRVAALSVSSIMMKKFEVTTTYAARRLQGLPAQPEQMEAMESARAVAHSWSETRKDRALRPIEERLRSALRQAWAAQAEAVIAELAALQHRLESPAAESLREAAMPLRFEEWEQLWERLPPAPRKLFEGPIEEALAAAMLAGGKDMLGELGLQTELRFDLKNPRAVAFLRGRAADLVTGIDRTTREGLARLVTAGAEEGKSYNNIAADIRRRYAEMALPKPQAHIRDRATLIAVTELGQGYEEAGLIVARDLAAAGLEMEKSWLTVGDERVSAVCAGNAAVGWIPAAQAFPGGQGRPLAHPGCRCTALYRRKPGTASLPPPTPPAALRARLEKGVPDSRLRYERSPKSFRPSSLENARRLYRDRPPGKSATDVALEQPPIRIEFQEQDGGALRLPDGTRGTLSLTDGRHRWLAANLAGAEQIRAEVRFFDAQFEEQSKETITLGIRATDAQRAAQRALARKIQAAGRKGR